MASEQRDLEQPPLPQALSPEELRELWLAGPPPAPLTPGVPQAFQDLVGKRLVSEDEHALLSPEERAQAVLVHHLPQNYRVLYPGDLQAHDLHRDRLNLYLERESNRIMLVDMR